MGFRSIITYQFTKGGHVQEASVHGNLYLVRRVYLKGISVDLINTNKALGKSDFARNKNFNIGSQHNIECKFGDILNGIHDELGNNENSFFKLIPPNYKLVKHCTKCKRKTKTRTTSLHYTSKFT